MKTRYFFEVSDEQDKFITAIVSMMKSEFGVDVREMKRCRNSRFSTPVGAGFGDCVWRVNYRDNQIEASFAKPCWQSKAIKSSGMKWNHEGGFWYAPNEQRFADACNILKLSQVDSIPAE